MLSRLVSFILVAAAWGCSDEVTYQQAEIVAPDHVEIPVWVQPGSALVSAQAAATACDRLAPLGITCVKADEASARLRIMADDSTCEKVVIDGETLTKGGTSGLDENGDGFVRIFTDCLPTDLDAENLADMIIETITHETLHTCGVRHVPLRCDGSDKENQILHDADGTPICGEWAVMNPVGNIHLRVPELLPMDFRAFHIRMSGYLFPTGHEKFFAPGQHQ